MTTKQPDQQIHPQHLAEVYTSIYYTCLLTVGHAFIEQTRGVKRAL